MKIGIDIGGSHIASGIVGEDGSLVGKETKDISKVEIKNEKDAKKMIIETIDNEINSLLKRYDYEIGDISKIGIAVPGNPTENVMKNIVNLHIKEFEIGKILEEKYDVKVKMKNDGKCAGLAEKEYGNLRKYDDCIFLCIGTGIGSAVFMNGDLLEPKNNPGFEFGHTIIDKKGPKCNCGKKGCFEVFASMKRFKREVIKNFKLDENIKSEDVQKFIRENLNAEAVEKMIDDYICNLVIGISNIINIFEPQAICFGGSFSYYSDIFIPKLNAKIKEFLFNKDSKYDFLCAKLQNDAGIIGASML